MICRCVLPLCLFAVCAAFASADDWPQWRGPNRDGRSAESGLLPSWPEKGPTLTWLNETCGHGYSGAAVVKDRIYTLGARGELRALPKWKTFLIAIDAKTGKEVWATELSEMFFHRTSFGPRATPTFDDGRLYALTGNGTLACVKENGERVWQRQLTGFGGRVPEWGYSESILVDQKFVICTPGGADGAILAFDKKTGQKMWQSKDCTDGAQYSSVVGIRHDGIDQLVQLTDSHVVGVRRDDGRLVWSSPWRDGQAAVATPIFRDGLVFVSSAYKPGCKQVRLFKDADPTVVFENTNMKNQHGGVVLVGDHLFGYSEQRGWICQDWKTGDIIWSDKKRLGKGSLTYADGQLYCLTESDGIVALIAASKNGFEESGRFTLQARSKVRTAEELVWSHPAVSNGKLYLRDHEFLSCFDIRAHGE